MTTQPGAFSREYLEALQAQAELDTRLHLMGWRRDPNFYLGPNGLKVSMHAPIEDVHAAIDAAREASWVKVAQRWEAA